jgi:hypothetical protein
MPKSAKALFNAFSFRLIFSSLRSLSWSNPVSTMIFLSVSMYVTVEPSPASAKRFIAMMCDSGASKASHEMVPCFMILRDFTGMVYTCKTDRPHGIYRYNRL